MSAVRRVVGRRGLHAAAATLAAGATLAGVGIAGAADNQTITVAADATEGQWDKQAVTIQTGESVTWSFAGAGHNVESTSGDPGSGAAKDPRWETYAYPPGEFQVAPRGSQGSFTFYKNGTYNFICVFHANMTGVVTVEGEDQDIPSGTPTPTPPTGTPTPQPTTSPQPTVSPQPTPDDHTQTPPPGGSSAGADTTKPVISRVTLRGLKRAARVRFRLSENATVTLQFRKRGSTRVIRSARLQARAGTRTVTVRSPKLRKGRYTVTITARDAMGNRSASRRAALRIRR